MHWPKIVAWLAALSSLCAAIVWDRNHILWGLLGSENSLDTYIPDDHHHIETLLWPPYRRVVENKPTTPVSVPAHITAKPPSAPAPTDRAPKAPVNAPDPVITAPVRQQKQPPVRKNPVQNPLPPSPTDVKPPASGIKPPRRIRTQAPIGSSKPTPTQAPGQPDDLLDFRVVKDPRDVPGYEFTLPEHHPGQVTDFGPWIRSKWNQYWRPDQYPSKPEGKKAAQEKAIRDANDGRYVDYITPANIQEEMEKIYDAAKEVIGSGFLHYYGPDYTPPKMFPDSTTPQPSKQVAHRQEVGTMKVKDDDSSKPYWSSKSIPATPPQGVTDDGWDAVYGNFRWNDFVKEDAGVFEYKPVEPYPEFQYKKPTGASEAVPAEDPDPAVYAVQMPIEEMALLDYDDWVRDLESGKALEDINRFDKFEDPIEYVEADEKSESQDKAELDGSFRTREE